MNAKPFCKSCRGPKAKFECGLCKGLVCKSCIQEVNAHDFSYMSETPEELLQGNVCPQCFDDKVASHKQNFDELLEKAKEVYFLTKAYPDYFRVFQKHTKRVEVNDCDDRRETIMRLAFYAAELGFNAVIDSTIESKKVRMGRYQSSRWMGSGLPASIDGEDIDRVSMRKF